MPNYVGDFAVDSTVYVWFSTFDSTGASVTISNFAVGDVLVYKDGGTTQRASTSGYTLLDTDGVDFDGLTGVHGVKIDTSDNTDAGFYAAGHEYTVVIGPITCDSRTLNFVAAEFSIERSGAALALLKNATYGLSALETLVDGLEAGVNVTSIANDVITAASIATGAIDADAIADNAIDAGAIATGAIDADAIADNAITAAAIATDAIDADAIAATAVTEIQAGLATAISIAALNDLSAAEVNAEVVDVLRTDLLPDSYSADGVQPTFAQAVLAIHQFLHERAVVGTTVTVYKPDGATAVMTFTLNSATNPTLITRTT